MESVKDRSIFWLTALGVGFWLIALNHVAFWDMLRAAKKIVGGLF
jgi:hypothetical protein